MAQLGRSRVARLVGFGCLAIAVDAAGRPVRAIGHRLDRRDGRRSDVAGAARRGGHSRGIGHRPLPRADHERRRHVHFHGGPAGRLHHPRESGRLQRLRAAQHRAPRQRAPLRRRPHARPRRHHRDDRRDRPGQFRADAELGAVGADHVEPARTARRARPRRGLDLPDAARRLVSAGSGRARRRLRHDDPEHRRQPQHDELDDGRRPVEQRPRQPADLQQHDQLRRDRRSERAAQQLSRRAWQQRRRGRQHRHQVGHARLQGHGVLVSPARVAERERLLQQPERRHQAALSLQHARRRARRPGAEDEGPRVLLLLVRGSQHADAASRCGP